MCQLLPLMYYPYFGHRQPTHSPVIALGMPTNHPWTRHGLSMERNVNNVLIRFGFVIYFLDSMEAR